MNKPAPTLALTLASLLAACGGGGTMMPPGTKTPADYPLWAWATGSSGLFGSSDDGATWVKASETPGIPAGAAKVDGRHVAVSPQGEVSLSDDSGKTWSTSSLAALPTRGVTAFFAGAKLWAGSTGALYRSGDKGSTWTKVGAGLPSSVSSVDGIAEVGASVLVVEALAGVYRSTDDGQTFSISNGGIPQSVVANAVGAGIATWNGKVYAAFQGSGVYVSSDEGASWALSSNGLPATGLSRLWPVGNQLFAGPPTAGVFVTTDGASWAQACTLPPNESVLRLFSVGTRLFLVTTNSSKFGVFVSTDGGKTCTRGTQPQSTPGIDDPLSFVLAR